MPAFAHLHLHTEYSLLDGACRIAEIPEAVKAGGMDAVALTDLGVMYGAVAFFKACREAGVKPIIGCEVLVAPRKADETDLPSDRNAANLVLLCRNRAGYANLSEIVSRSFLKGMCAGTPRTDRDTLARFHDGLIALSGGKEGEVARALLEGDRSRARELILWYRDTFGRENFYLELQRHGEAGERTVNDALIGFSRELDVPLVATNDVHYLRKEDAELQRALVAIGRGALLEDVRDKEGEQYDLKSASEMERLFRDVPEAVENASRIAQACGFAFDFDETHLPVFPTPRGLTADGYLEALCFDGLRAKRSEGKIPDDPAYEDRLRYELEIVKRMGFSDYYLIVWDFVRFARSRGIPVGPGRGSGVGSLAAYCVGITSVDPLPYGLLFERFLNPERVSMPDFDIDFADERRGEVIAYVTEKYGKDHVAQIVTFGTMACKQAMRDAGRVLGMPVRDVDALVRLVPGYFGVTLKNALEESEALRERRDSDPDAAKLLRLALWLEGRPRNASTHATGVVVTDRPLTEYLPLSVNEDVTVTQYPMNTVAELGLLKIDFLGLRYLSILHDAELQVRRTLDPEFDLEKLPENDPAAYRLLSGGSTLGLFQLESRGMRSLLQKLQPRTLEDVVSVISLYRPGPAISIETFLKNRKNPAQTAYLTPELEPILSGTHGCMLYQEQVMQICRSLAGFTLGHADLVRRAMAKKKKDAMERERTAFTEGCKANGIPEETAEALFRQMSEFAKYAFNKSHAVAYAVVAYRTAYLKAHYPQIYMCALINSVAGSTEKIKDYAEDCFSMGIRVLPPDVNRSGADFAAEGENIRFGLAAIKNVGALYAERLVRERENGPYTGIDDFFRRVGRYTNARAAESLVRSGALDAMGHRGPLLGICSDKLAEQAQTRGRQAEGQIGMFDGAEPETDRRNDPFFARESIPFEVRLQDERELTGLYFSGHPLDGYRDYAKKTGALSLRELRHLLEDDPGADGREVHFIGMVTGVRPHLTKKNERMSFLKVEDTGDAIDVIVFPKTYAVCGDAIRAGDILDFDGYASFEEGREGAESEAAPTLKLILNKICTPETNSPDSSAILEPGKTVSAAESGNEKENASGSANENPPPTSPDLYLRVDADNREKLGIALAEVRKHPGASRVLVYFAEEKKLRAATDVTCVPEESLLSVLRRLLGSANVATR